MLFQNPNVQGVDQITVPHPLYIRHGTKIGLGEKPGELVFEDVPDTVRKRLGGLLRRGTGKTRSFFVNGGNRLSEGSYPRLQYFRLSNLRTQRLAPRSWQSLALEHHDK